ncbi:hypothetical protein ABZY81_11295 [Streptomyces sp. NPDC006514]|uniref:hypothetical protein n=1 Tax=Streptomyces sp. NPDC006514 TaxID=3154308 RepID=UPI0033A08066
MTRVSQPLRPPTASVASDQYLPKCSRSYVSPLRPRSTFSRASCARAVRASGGNPAPPSGTRATSAAVLACAVSASP